MKRMVLSAGAVGFSDLIRAGYYTRTAKTPEISEC